VSVHSHPSSTVEQLRALLEVGKLVRDERDLGSLFDQVATTIADALGVATVSINVHRPAWDDFEVVTVHGSEAARTTLLGNTSDPDSWRPYLEERFRRRGAYFIPHGDMDWVDPYPVYVPDFVPSDQPDAWHPEDTLIVPLERSDGHILGFISIDEPASGRRPDDDDVDLLVALAGHVAAAIESAQNTVVAQRHREALAQLLEISSQLAGSESVDGVLGAVARGISSALGFGKVVVALPDPAGHFVARGTAGWSEGDPALDFFLTLEDTGELLDPAFEIEGCTLMTHFEAEARVGTRSNYRSRLNGRGPRAWNRHWLIVPLVEADGSIIGFVWADDPEDHLLPSPERLQALRTFANQATVALRAAIDVETLNRRNLELAALHDTAFGLLERLELDGVLHAIVDNARRLVDTPNAYLYLVDKKTGTLRMHVGLGLFEEHTGQGVLPHQGTSGQVVRAGKTVVIDDYAAWEHRLVSYDEYRFRAVVGVPLSVGGELAGVIGIARQETRAFSPSEIALLERFARLASLALENARLYAALHRSEKLHRSVVDGSTDLIALLDEGHEVLLASPACEDILGYSPEDLIGAKLADFLHRDDLAAARSRVVDDAVAEPTTVRMRHRDGHWVLVEGITTPIRNDAGVIELTLVIGRDVTEKERLQEQLRQAQKLEAVGRLAGGIAHDFNNLLTAVRGYAELLLIDLDAEDDSARESAREIARAAERAASLTGQLLAFSRKQVLQPQLIDVNEVIAGLAPMLRRTLGDDVVLSTSLAADAGTTLADPTQLEQVLLNLAINGRDAMPGGGTLQIATGLLEVDVKDELPHSDLKPGSYVMLTVADSGVGVEPDVVKSIFDPFFTTKEVGQGTGLGLATVHGIVSESGGAVWVESVPGQGTCFTVCLPRAAQ
jgi:PAS domain S-box-containing protein